MKQVINFEEKFSLFKDQWAPKIIARMNGYHFKLVRFAGSFVWHQHQDTEEAFIILDGEMKIHFRESNYELKKGEMLVIPKGVEHMTSAKSECKALLIEEAGTVNTGKTVGERTAPEDTWI
jgi:mannose-6-phosphate isomerase-like protein (cupin superfamily)